MPETAEVVICGAGIAGVAAAYYLAVECGMRGIVLVEQGAPLALTSDKSTECYRNWWPGPGDTMVALMNRSIDLLEQIAHASDNAIQLNRRGYLYATADPERIPTFVHLAEEASALGAGSLRIHGAPASGQSTYIPVSAEGFVGQPDGADLILDQALIRAHFPYLNERTIAILHARRCGWFSAQQLGMYLLDRAREHGVRLIRATVTAIDTTGGRVRSVTVAEEHGTTRTIASGRFVNAAGPMQKTVARLLGVDLPVFSERHIKIAFNDHRGIVPRDAPLLIWTDPTRLAWSEDERIVLEADPSIRWLLDTFPAGVHGRPEGRAGGSVVLLLWTYHPDPVEPDFPLHVEPHHAEIVVRGMAAMAPGLAAYFDHMPKTYIDGGYYTRTRENRPLIGPLPVKGAYMIGALSGFGLMAACAAGELLAAHITGAPLPAYAPALLFSRYDDPAYRALLDHWGESGQL
jgi:glycine/D-amino acid oxidase-like deaminating enzyme